MGQESCQKVLQLKLSLLQESRVHVAPILLLRELGNAVDALDVLLDGRLEGADRGVAIINVERDVLGGEYLDEVRGVLIVNKFVRYYFNAEAHSTGIYHFYF